MDAEKEITITHDQIILSELERGILNALLYFDIFNYPLTKKELWNFCQTQIILPEVFNETLAFLLKKELINKVKNFYFVTQNISIVERRITGNFLAEKFILTAEKYSRIISKFPFVRAVFISGSLSKGYMDEKSDIDYFIITKPGRLWICRTLLVLFKKIFLFNSHKYFCVNYFIDENNLEIHDKNIFTATELVTLIPMINQELFEKFVSQNTWTNNFFPNNHSLNNKLTAKKKNVLKKYLEKILNGSTGNKLDDFCLKITLNFWKKKFNHFNQEDFKDALRSKKDVSKHHPNKFQEKVLTLFDEKIKQFEKSHHVSLGTFKVLETSFYQ
jgi:hypothetical protein